MRRNLLKAMRRSTTRFAGFPHNDGRLGIRYRALRCEPLEDRRLLSFVVPNWMEQGNVEYTQTGTEETGLIFDVYVKDLDYGFDTPSEWIWAPFCFDDPLVDFADLRTGYETGWSFSISRPYVGDVCPSGKAAISDSAVGGASRWSDPVELAVPVALGCFEAVA